MRQAETTPSNLEDDLNMFRSALRELTGETRWYDEPINNLREIAAQTGTSKLVLYRLSELQQVTVPAAQNFVALDVLGYPPSEVKAVNAETEGAPVALLPGAAGAMHSLNAASLEANLMLIRLAGTNEAIIDGSGQMIMGLLQVDSDATDGTAFGLAGDEAAQISFVVRDPGTESLVAANAVDIAGKVIEYAYTIRKQLVNAPENFHIAAEGFVKPPSSTGTVTVNFEQDSFAPAFNGQTNFVLSSSAAVGGVSTAYVNGIAYFAGTHYTISGTSFTWLDFEFTLSTTDDLVVEYVT